MSLNGLDAPAVQEASQYAVAESGGWFLLRYVNRDSVELYERGRAGVNEARAAIAIYEEQSPLYGLILYRRRKVLIKYVPEGTSRLLQARTAVHFQDILERYSPYETLLEIKTADGLSDTALAGVFTLHTASPAVSSNRLNEISEDAEDDGSGAPVQAPPPSRPVRERRSDRPTKIERQRTPRKSSTSPPPAIQVNGETSPVASLASPKSTISQLIVREESGQRSISSLGTPSIASVTEYAASDRSDTNTEPESAPPSKAELVQLASPPPDRSPGMKPLPQEPLQTEAQPTADARQPTTGQERAPFVPETRIPTGFHDKSNSTQDQFSIQSLKERNDAVGRPSTDKPYHDDDPYDLKKYDYLFKPKQKLGPRLVPQDTKKARPSMPSVAAVPSNIKPQPPKKDAPVRPKSQGPAAMSASQLPVLPAPPPIPDMPEYNPRPLSRGSVKSLPSHKSTAMTPDKLRLMKAIELRKKQMRKSQGAEFTGTPKFDADLPEVPKLPEQSPRKESSRRVLESTASLEPDEAPSKKADSGIEMDYRDAEKREDKQTLEMLESPKRKRRTVDRRRDAEDARTPTLAAEENSDLTPKAEAVSPSSALDATQAGATVPREKDPSRIEMVALPTEQTAEVAQVPTIIQPASPQNAEPSLDESQVFGDDPERRFDEDRLEAPSTSPRRQNSDIAKRRRGYIEPLHLEDMSSDDEFVEELRTASVQEAKPITVAKSPVMESFIRRPSYGSSHLLDTTNSAPDTALQRTVSAESAQSAQHETFSPDSREPSPSAERYDPMAGLKRNVSSGISRRIQALADMSSRETSPNGYNANSRPITPEASLGSLTPRDRGIQSRGSLRPSRSRTSSFQKTARLSAGMSAQPPHHGASMYQHENAPVLNVHRDPATNRDSVSVKARIVRPSTNDDERPPAEDLQRPSYLMNNDRPVPTETMAQLTRLDTSTPSLPRSESAASISPEARRMSTDQPTRTMHSSTRNQFGRHKQPQPAAGTPISPQPDDFPIPPVTEASRTQSATSVTSATDEAAAPKESTRASRFFKRMSNIATKRRSAAQGSVASESTNSMSELSKGGKGSRDGEKAVDMPPPVVVGSLNVQFPDSLLWKRRIVSIDSDGHLVFTIPQAMEHQRSVAAKKFALTDFRAPYVPDLDRQELPFSVMLDFGDGSGMTLQAAAEDAGTHKMVVVVLKRYWGAWAGQG